MYAIPLTRSTLRLLAWFVVLAFLVVQGFQTHFHTFAGHDSDHGHGHEIELHVSGVPTDSGHDEPDGKADVVTFAILKKIGKSQAGDMYLPLAVLLLFVAIPGVAPWRPARFASPAPGGDVRTPPLRGPPR
ncbi:MAG: hypothetical protein OEV31_00510 [Gammaproteobacteria bacterium]|nr:hypothetical protein [Gammaproteobacteria bacterium]